MKNKSIYHWLVVAACCGLSCSAIGIAANCAGIFYTPVSSGLGVGRGDIALYSTIGNIVGGLLSPLISKLVQKVKLKLLLSIGIITLAVSTAVLSLANSVWLFYVMAIFIGIGFSTFGIIPITIIISNWFFKKHGFATSLALSFSGIGGALFNPIFNSLIQSVGWRSAYLVAAVLIVILSLPGVLFILKLTPAEKGLLPYGAENPTSSAGAKASLQIPDAKKALSSPLFFIICIFSVLITFVTGMGSHFAGYAEEVGLSVSIGALMISTAMVGNVTFKLLLGILSDLMGAIKSCTIMISFTSIALATLSFVPEDFTIIPMVAAFLYGAVFAVAAVGVPLVVKAIFGPKNSPTVYSYISIFTFCGGAVALTIIGYIYDIFGSYKIATVVCLILAVASLVFLNIGSLISKKVNVRE